MFSVSAVQFLSIVVLLNPLITENQAQIPEEVDLHQGFDNEKIIPIEDAFVKTKKSHVIIHKKHETKPNLTFVFQNYKDEKSINKKGVLLDLFISEGEFSLAQARTLLLLVLVVITALSTFVMIVCFFHLLSMRIKYRGYDPFDPVTSLDYHKGGGGI
ncbi:hypothetical protein RF11_12779 [Thelohanellus kitauei]|uniref:Uncharacterized protein n=1 Tax=Thelohanellus kitauei TaxID=669202 RepID=A0A0C2M2Q6_THEKT|nr:hypothetical protein RF11_12779 [Thelohanellus kitauei]